MADPLEEIDRLLHGPGDRRRWVQESPFLPNVWKALVRNPGDPVDLLMTPQRGCRPGELAEAIRGALESSRATAAEAAPIDVAHNKTTVVAEVFFPEIIRLLAPLSGWYQSRIAPLVTPFVTSAAPGPMPEHVQWWLQLVDYVARRSGDPQPLTEAGDGQWSRAFALMESPPPGKPLLFRASLNRVAEPASFESIQTVKADAARRVFDVKTDKICWAVLDSGIDARHEAFLDEAGMRTRVRETYDFTLIRKLIALASTPGSAAETALQTDFGVSRDVARKLQRGLTGGGDIDWEALKPALRIDHSSPGAAPYFDSLHPHGTHVAGILGGKPKKEADGDNDFAGMCPEIRLVDIRILDKSGRSKDGPSRAMEFDAIAALQFVAHLNSFSDEPAVHGVNLSIQLQHDPSDSACGRTPVCEECNRLSASGVVVVAAAGNMGIDSGELAANTTAGAFRGISIADPGNADSVITVGSTHRKRPHTYGVSFFSSRGPTGDGRQKPDLVAPGEKILGPVPGAGYEEMQGTSQAAPHVSGAAAMLLARHTELIGDPERVKRVLCATATDLGRTKEFQGAGLIDVLRALQSI